MKSSEYDQGVQLGPSLDGVGIFDKACVYDPSCVDLGLVFAPGVIIFCVGLILIIMLEP